LLELESDPYSMFIFAMNAPQTREKYTTRLKRFFDFIDLRDDKNNNATTTHPIEIKDRMKYRQRLQQQKYSKINDITRQLWSPITPT